MMSHGCEAARGSKAETPRARLLHCKPILVAALSILPAGCQSPKTSPDTPARVSARRQGPLPEMSAYSVHYPDAPPVFGADDVTSLLRDLKHHVVILECWASWSRRSREELTTLAKLNDELHSQGLRIIACNFDPPADWTTRTVPTLLAAKANFPCVIVRREDREALHAWLAPDWSYDLPARFVFNRDGRVIARAFSSTPVTTVMARARQRVAVRPPIVSVTRRSASEVILRSRLVNVATGEWETLPVAIADRPDANRLAKQVVSTIATRLDRAHDQRIALLPFVPAKDRRTAGPFGTRVATIIRQGLQHRGFSKLVGPQAAGRLISQAGISAMAVDYDPSVTRGRLAVDYLIIGRLGGATVRQSIAADSRGEEPGADDVVSQPRHRAIGP